MTKRRLGINDRQNGKSKVVNDDDLEIVDSLTSDAG